MTDAPTTRTMIAQSVGDLFGWGPATKDELVSYAEDSHALDDVIDALEALPDRTFPTLRDLWPHLADLPVGA
jgi:hypothetical protein